jgi:hypothetical protein
VALAGAARASGVRLSALLDMTPAAMEVPDYGTPAALEARTRFNGHFGKVVG